MCVCVQAPELYAVEEGAEPEFTRKSDLWACGVIAYAHRREAASESRGAHQCVCVCVWCSYRLITLEFPYESLREWMEA